MDTTAGVDEELNVRMELFPERDGNSTCNSFALIFMSASEWSSSLKGMETKPISYKDPHVLPVVRMELFPERDGNLRANGGTGPESWDSPNGALP